MSEKAVMSRRMLLKAAICLGVSSIAIPSLRALDVVPFDELSFSSAFESGNVDKVQKLFDQWMSRYFQAHDDLLKTRNTEFVRLSQIAMTYDYFLIADWERKGGIIARDEESQTISERFAAKDNRKFFSKVAIVSKSLSIAKNDRMVLNLADVAMLNPPVHILSWYTPKIETGGFVTLLTMTGDVSELVLKTLEDALNTPKLADNEKYKDLNAILSTVINTYQEFGHVQGLTGKDEEHVKFEVLQYLIYKINWTFNPSGAVPGHYIFTGEPQLVRVETIQDGVAYARQVQPMYESLAPGIYVYGFQPVVNLDALEEIFGAEPRRAIVPKEWAGVRAECKKLAEPWNALIAKSQYINGNHEKSHQRRWRIIAHKAFPNAAPQDLNLIQFGTILTKVSTTFALDELIARMGELNTSVQEGRKNDIWLSLVFLLTAPSFEESHIYVLFALLSGEHEVLIMNMETALEQRDAAKFVELLSSKFDMAKLVETWLGITNDQLHGVADKDGLLPVDVLAKRIPTIYNLLYDYWDFVHEVSTPKEAR